MNQLVFKENNQIVTNSRNVARDFNKQHRHVLESIDSIKGVAENWADLFRESYYTHEQNKQEYREYLINRDGFTLLVMGFTGKEAMKFKLKYIEAFNQMENQLIKPKSQLEILQGSINQLVEQERKLVEQDKRIETVERRQEDITEVLSLNPTEWRKKVNSLLNKIAQSRGGFNAYKEVRSESYQYLEDRAKCQLSVRLTNRKRKMALEGASKSRVDKTSKMDVIADDARLTEIYLAIVKEMAVKHNVEIGDVS